MLPWPHGIGIADQGRPTAGKRLKHIWNQSVLRPISATDHVARTRTRDGDGLAPMFFSRKKRASVSCRDELGTALAAGIRIVAAQRLIPSLDPGPFPSLVAHV